MGDGGRATGCHWSAAPPWVAPPHSILVFPHCVPVCQLGRAQEEGPHTLISYSPGVPSVSYFFFSLPFPPPSSQKRWFSSESLKRIFIPKTSSGINSSQCRGLFFFLLPILLLLASKPRMNSARTLAIPARPRCAAQDREESEGFPSLPTQAMQCCFLVLLRTVCRDKALSPH